MIEKMYSGIVGYTISDDNSFSLRVELGMRDPVDGDILQKSVDEIGQRFSYLKQRLACNATDVYYETTDRDFVLKKTNQPIRLNSAESNGNLLAFSYDDQHIYIDAFHGQLDGIGFLILTKALLYNYCLKKYGEPLHVDDVIKVEDPVEPEEIHDPWYELLKTYKPAKLTKVGKKLSGNKLSERVHSVKKVLRLEKEGLVTPSKTRLSKLELSVEDVLNYCRTFDGSPATSIPLMLAEAIHSVHPDTDKEIIISIAVNHRPALGVRHSHHSTSDNIRFSYNEKVWNKDRLTQGTILRGFVILNTEEERIRRKILFTTRFLDVLNKIPFRRLKKTLLNIAAADYLYGQTACVSYIGKSNFGDIDKYLSDFYLLAESYGVGIGTELTSVGDTFFLAFNQDWLEDIYLDAFLKVLDKNKIRYRMVSQGPLSVSEVERPWS